VIGGLDRESVEPAFPGKDPFPAVCVARNAGKVFGRHMSVANLAQQRQDLSAHAHKEMLGQRRARQQQGADRKAQAEVVVAGQEMNVRPLVDQAAKGVQHVEVGRALVETVAADDDFDLAPERGEGEAAPLAARRTRRNEGAQETVRIGMGVGNEDDRPVGPGPGAMGRGGRQAFAYGGAIAAGMVLVKAPGFEIAGEAG
jgi:hypothetical protein